MTGLNNDLQKKTATIPIYWVCNRFITLQLSKMGFYHFTSDMSLFTISSAVYSSISVFVTCLICYFFRRRYTNSRKIVLKTESSGMKTSIPTIPIRFPPIVTAARTQIDGSPTDSPTT